MSDNSLFIHTCTFTHSEKPQTFVVDQATNFNAVTKGAQEFVKNVSTFTVNWFRLGKSYGFPLQNRPCQLL